MDQETDGEPHLFFKVSTALKRVIGRDLITDDLVAVFELVKNGFDAKAQRVELVFEDDRLLIIDDGKGMSLDDIERKWLFVAYSAKRDGTEDEDYRDRIGASRSYAGSKGVGRFSCDRLGRFLKMQTRRSGEPVEVLDVDWEDFERDAREEFKDVGIAHSEATQFELPEGVDAPKTGTVLEISGSREPWTRDKLLRLRTALAKLINPFGHTDDRFEVTIRAKAEEAQDEIERQNRTGEGMALSVVNGPIANFIFDTLKDKTTHLEVWLSEDGKRLDVQAKSVSARALYQAFGFVAAEPIASNPVPGASFLGLRL